MQVNNKETLINKLIEVLEEEGVLRLNDHIELEVKIDSTTKGIFRLGELIDELKYRIDELTDFKEIIGDEMDILREKQTSLNTVLVLHDRRINAVTERLKTIESQPSAALTELTANHREIVDININLNTGENDD